MKQIHLYVKTHNVTGMKYFGKTTESDPAKYKGSGKYWSKHLKKHGDNVSTEIIGKFDSLVECTEFAIKFSIENDIVKSDKWANLIDENGLDGAPVGHPGHQHSEEHKKRISEQSKARWADPDFKERVRNAHIDRWKNAELKRMQSMRMTGVRNPEHSKRMTGRIMSEETKVKLRKPKHAGHGVKVSAALRGISKSDEHKRSLAISRQKIPGIFIDHMGIEYPRHTDFLKKYGFDAHFFSVLDKPLGQRRMFEKLDIPFQGNHTKTRAELGFRFEQKLI